MAEEKQLHCLVLIEDNPADTMLLRQALDEQNDPYSLEVLPDGETALRYVREQCCRSSPEPCLIILDLHLPQYDGATVLRAIRSRPRTLRCCRGGRNLQHFTTGRGRGARAGSEALPGANP